MAGVLGALASYVINMLTDMATEEVAMLIGVSGEINQLSVKLGDLKNVLADADRRNITDESVQGWVEELKRAMYLATDIIDLCQLKAMEQGPSKDMGCLNPLLFCMRNPLHAHDIGSRIKELNQKLDDICKRGNKFKFAKLEAYQDRKMTHPPLVDRKTHPVLELSGVVGEKIEDDTKALVQLLTKEPGDENDSIMVFAIVGVGGIGKTTLSKKVFNDEAIQDKFSKKIWLSITQEFSVVELLRTAITAADGILPGHGGGFQDKALLVPALDSAIKDKKFFLVLDDMWGVDEWNKWLMPPFSKGAPGSRILVTTRHETVARGMEAMEPFHHVSKLGDEDAWSLLKKQVLRTEKSEHVIHMLKDIGLQIIAKCDGLPLAIKVMGGLLCQRKKEQPDWEKVLNDTRTWSVSPMPNELNYALYLSYEDLDPCLKQCFLHFSLKPKKTSLTDTQLVSMWIGEGFIHGNSDRLEELGIECHKELISRNLIEPDTSHLGQYFCNMHDVVRSFAHFIARNEALVAHDGETINSKLGLRMFLRLSIETKGMEPEEFEWRCLQKQKSLRMLILTGRVKIQPGDSFITCSSLRVLHIEFANFAALVGSMDQLKHLRYFNVRNCDDIKTLPENIHNMKFLQHISLEGCKNLVKLPDSIVKLRELRYLDIDNTCVNSMPRGFCALTNLRSLWGFQTHMYGDWCSLEELGPLSKLRCIGLMGLKNVSAASFATKARLGEKKYLSRMELWCSSSKLGDDGLVNDGVSEKDRGIIEEVFGELDPPPSVEYILIAEYFGRQLPRWMMQTSTTPLTSLRILVMKGLACCTQLPDGLCQLPCLEFLMVNQAPAIKHVGPEFVQPHSHCQHPSSQAAATFPRLHKMILHEMVEWQEWEWKEDLHAMPVLEELLIRSCKLGRMPPGLASHARDLKILSIYSVQCLQSIENFASVVDLDLYDLPDLTRISNFPRLQKLEIHCCRKLKSLQEMTALRRLVLTVHYDEEQLPMYLQTVKPSHLLLDCSPELLASMALGKSGREWDKFSHIQHVEAYADDGELRKKWHLFYTSEPYSMEINIDPQGCSRFEDILSRYVALLLSGNEDEEDVEDNEDKIEEE